MKTETKTEKSTLKMSVIKRWLILLVFLFCGIFALSYNNTSAQEVSNVNIEMPIEEMPSEIILPQDLIREQMIDEVNNYLIKSTRGKQNDPFISQCLVDNALKYNIDLCFIMSQTSIETCFGTTGAGRANSRKSLFGVSIKRYSSYNDAIEDYCKLLRNKYLVKGKSEKDLLKRYVNLHGHRYATNPNYEKILSKEYHKISSKTNLQYLQNSYYEEFVAMK